MPADPAPPSSARVPADLVSTMVATAFGAGYSPFAPGTAGSAVGLLLFWPLHHLPLGAQLAAVAALYFAGVAASTRVARGLGVEDPGLVVVDEVVGMWTSLLLLPFTPWTAAAGFVLFRVMDVFKPYPARQFESLPGGWGIMTDDLMAGIYANLLLRVGLVALGA
jgi:phosphatidylglycerophosphatase A